MRRAISTSGSSSSSKASAARRKRSSSRTAATQEPHSCTARISQTARLYLPPLYPYQRQVVEDPNRDVATVSATQIGKTFGETCWLLARAWEDPLRIHPWWWTGPTYAQVVPAFRLMVAIAGSAGVLAGSPVESAPQRLKLINGAVIEYRSRDNFEGLMGATIAGGVVDEAGIMTLEQHAAISTRRSATLGPLHYIGNPGMVAGPFRKLCALGETGDGIHSLHRWTWADRFVAIGGDATAQGRAYADFIEQERQTLADFEFRRLYEAEWTEDEAAVFRGVDECTDSAPYTRDPVEQYAVGVDVGQQVDYLVAVAIGVNSRRTEGMLRFNGIPQAQAADRVAAFMQKFPGFAVVETNGPGLAFLSELRRRNVRAMGFDTTARSKENIIEALAGSLNPETKRLTLTPLPPLQHELKVFRYVKRTSGALVGYKYSAPPGEHDDCVMALAIANYGRALAHRYTQGIQAVRIA